MNCLFTYSQKKYTFGKPTTKELALKTYKLDTTANAAVLFESANTTFKVGVHNVIVSTSFFKNKIPKEINLLSSDLEKAKAIYIYIKTLYLESKI